jgi:hypothetical protein
MPSIGGPNPALPRAPRRGAHGQKDEGPARRQPRQGEAPSEHVRAWFGELPPLNENEALAIAVRKQRADFGKLGHAARDGNDWAPLIEEGRRLLTEKKAHSKRQAAAMVAKNHPGVNADTLRLKL